MREDTRTKLEIKMFKTANGWTKAKIKKHVIANFKGQSVIDKVCQYRGEDGAKCAIGMFMPDSEYEETFEGKGVSLLLKDNPHLEKFMPLKGDGLNHFQDAHDVTTADSCLDQILDFIDEKVEDAT